MKRRPYPEEDTVDCPECGESIPISDSAWRSGWVTCPDCDRAVRVRRGDDDSDDDEEDD